MRPPRALPRHETATAGPPALREPLALLWAARLWQAQDRLHHGSQLVLLFLVSPGAPLWCLRVQARTWEGASPRCGRRRCGPQWRLHHFGVWQQGSREFLYSAWTLYVSFSLWDGYMQRCAQVWIKDVGYGGGRYRTVGLSRLDKGPRSERCWDQLGGYDCNRCVCIQCQRNGYPTPPPRTSIQNTPTHSLARPSRDHTRRLPLEQSPTDIRNAVSRQADVHTRDWKESADGHADSVHCQMAFRESRGWREGTDELPNRIRGKQATEPSQPSLQLTYIRPNRNSSVAPPLLANSQ